MGILDFWKKRANRLSLNELILRLKQDFQEEIRDFEHFKQLQAKKIEILRKIKEIWNKKWREAEELIRTHTPNLIREQLRFIGRDIKYTDEEDFILRYLLEIEKRRNSILGYQLNQYISPVQLEVYRNPRNQNLINQIKDVLRENSKFLKEHLIKLRENLNKQLQFFQRVNSWEAINQNEEFLKDLNEEQVLTQRIEHVMNDVIGKVNIITGLEFERIKEELYTQKIKELKRKKIYIRSVDCELTLGDIEKIVKGELPLVYYHGTPLDSLDIVFEEKCIIPLKRLELLKRIKELKRERPPNLRQKLHELISQYDSQYKRDTDFFKKMVILKEESNKLSDKLLNKVYPTEYHPQINQKGAFLRGSPFPLQLIKIIEQIKDLIKRKLELMAEGKVVPHYLETKIREYKNKAKTYVLSIYIDIKNLRPETDNPESWRRLYKNLESSKDFQEYLIIFFKYIGARLIVQILDEALVILVSATIKGRLAEKTTLNLFGIRDKWFVYFGAEPPYPAKTTFKLCMGYGTPLGTIGIVTGIVFEFKPVIEPFIEWIEIEKGGTRERFPVDVYPAAIRGRITYDIITKKKIDFRHLLRIYTAKNDIPYVSQKMREYEIDVPLYDFDDQLEFFRQAMDEMKQILSNHGLLA